LIETQGADPQGSALFFISVAAIGIAPPPPQKS
jgi:hypothetical protein